MLPYKDSWTKPGSVGRLIPSHEARIVDPDTGKDCTPGGAGELWIRGPVVMKGYLSNSEATRSSITPDGWYKTGDIGLIKKKSGVLHIVDRKKELIKVKGS